MAASVLASWLALAPSSSCAQWMQKQKLVGSDGVGAAQAGASVALSTDGSTALVGGPKDDAGKGAAWVFNAMPLNAQADLGRMIGKWSCSDVDTSSFDGVMLVRPSHIYGYDANSIDLTYQGNHPGSWRIRPDGTRYGYNLADSAGHVISDPAIPNLHAPPTLRITFVPRTPANSGLFRTTNSAPSRC